MMRLIVCCVLAALALAPRTSSAQPPKGPEIVGVRVGFADRYPVGCWTPVDVTLRGGDQSLPPGILSLTVPDGDGTPSRVSRPVQVVPGSETTERLYVRFGKIDSRLGARLQIEGRRDVVREFETDLQADGKHFLEALEVRQGLIVTVGPTSLGVEDALVSSSDAGRSEGVVARIASMGELPTRWYGYEGVDSLVLSTSHPEIYAGLTATDARFQAIDEWVRLGGRLVLLVGGQADAILNGATPLERFAPGKFREIVPLGEARVLEAYSGGAAQVQTSAERQLLAGALDDVSGVVEVRDGEVPLLVRSRYGFGEIVYAAFDLDRPPLADWADRKLLVRKMLELPAEASVVADESGALMNEGYDDMAGQLRAALDRFTNVELVPFWVVAALILAYIVCIGPIDYFFVRKVVGRMHFTWISFPVIVAAFCVGAYVLAHALKGDQMRTNWAEAIDIDDSTGLIRGVAWVNVFSPRMESYDIEMAPGVPGNPSPERPQVLLGWMGLPGDALGGMSQSDGGVGLWTRQYAFSQNLDRMGGVPIQVWSTKGFIARWQTQGTNPVRGEGLRDESDMLHGRITNTLDVPLKQVVIAYRRWAFDLGDLAPGQSVELGGDTRRSDLQTYLTGRHYVTEDKDKTVQQINVYQTDNAASPTEILRVMTFHESAGGLNYTRLRNDYQAFVDLSSLLRTGTAVLLATLPRSTTELLADGAGVSKPDDPRAAVLRVIYDVERPAEAP